MPPFIVDDAAVAEMTPEEEAKRISISLSYASRINYAVVYNQAPILRSLEIKNGSSLSLTDLKVVVKSSPEFLASSEYHIGSLAPSGSFSIDDLTEEVDFDYFAQLNRNLPGELIVELYHSVGAEKDRLLTAKSFPVELLSYEYWQGIEVAPTLLAAFVTPELNSISSILSEVRGALRSQNKLADLDGYNSNDPERVVDVLQAVFETVKQKGIKFIKERFAPEVQRVRFADTLLSDRVMRGNKEVVKPSRGKYLDISLFFASLLEAAGLHPIVVLQTGRTYVGCHLRPEIFFESFSDDLQALRKRVELGYIAVFDPTLALDEKFSSFDAAREAAKEFLTIPEKDFIGTLDVRRARLENTAPIPLKTEFNDTGKATLVLDPQRPRTYEFSSSERLAPIAEDDLFAENAAPASRVERWKMKLLDLSQRNKFLNYREDKKTLYFEPPEDLIPSLDSLLFQGQVFTPLPFTTDENLPNIKSGNKRELLEKYDASLRNDFEHRSLRCDARYDSAEINKRLKEISKKAQEFLQETGVNALYLAIGTIERPDSEDKKKKRFAPLILIPAVLSKIPHLSAYSLSKLDEDPILNIPLFEYMRRLGKEMRGLDPNYPPLGEYGVDIEKIFKLVQKELVDLKGWELHKTVSLSLFTFPKFVMWSDLNDHFDEIAASPIVDHLINSGNEPFVDNIETVPPEKLDAAYPYSKSSLEAVAKKREARRSRDDPAGLIVLF